MWRRGKRPAARATQTLRGGEFGTDLFLMNGHIHEAIPPIVVKEGDQVLIRLINAGTLAHPFHTHGHSFKIVATDGNPVPKAAQLTKDTVLIAPGERYDLVFEANNPGVWMVHCHIENHAANGMMTVIQYEGAKPTGPLAEFWDLTPTADGAAGAARPRRRGGPRRPRRARPAHGRRDRRRRAPPAAATADCRPDRRTPSAGGDVVWLAMVDDRFDPKSLTIKAGTDA